MSAAPLHAPPATLSLQVVEGLCGDMQALRLQAGDRLPTEPALAQRFGVSRTVVREAIHRLQAMGLVQTRHGIGSFVLQAPVPTRLQELDNAPEGAQQMLAMLELRISMEAEAAALAAQRRSETQLRGMRQALDDFAAAMKAGQNTLVADFQFHHLIAQATGNPYFQQVLDSLGRHTIADVTRPTASGQFSDSGEPRLLANKALTADEHEAVYDALRRGDTLDARAAMLVHLGNSRERMRHALAQG